MSPTTTTVRRYRALIDPLPLSKQPADCTFPTCDSCCGYFANGHVPNTDWKLAHNNAISGPRENERGIRDLIMGWLTYADQYETQYGSAAHQDEPCDECNAEVGERCRPDCTSGNRTLGDDYVLGAAWEAIGHELLTLLNGDLGRLDGGTLDHAIRAAFTLAGLDGDTA